MQYACNVLVRRVHVPIFAVEKKISITYSDCMSVALVIQHAQRLCRIVVCDLSGPTIIFRIFS